jgi:hypothetical protein
VVLARNVIGVVFDVVEGESLRTAAAAAQQVVVVVAGAVADPVEEFAVFGALGFYELLVGEPVQNAVDAGQSDADGRVTPEFGVELLGAAEAVTAPQYIQHGTLVHGHAVAAHRWALSWGTVRLPHSRGLGIGVVG